MGIITINLADNLDYRKLNAVTSYYVYFYIDPRNDTFFYVGKGKKQRAVVHWKRRNNHSNKLFQKILSEIQKCNLVPVLKILECKDEQAALDAEMFYISAFSTLVNYTLGGEGVSGYKHTRESIEKRLATIASKGGLTAWNKGLSGDKRCNGGRPKGIPMSQEAKQKLSEAMKGRSKEWLTGKKPWNYGKTKETHPSLQVISENMKGNNRGNRKT